MKRKIGKLFIVALLLTSFLGLKQEVFGVESLATPTISTSSALEATPAATVQPTPEVKTDLTQPTESKSRLERLLDEQYVSSTWPNNFLKVGIRKAIGGGVPANTIVLLLLFPLVAVLVAFSRNVIGINGFGIFTPAVVSVAFLATGITAGLVLFLAIIGTATLVRMTIRKVSLPYLPRMAVLIWGVSMAILGLLIAAGMVGMDSLINLGIFPILLFVLLAETFIDAQITRTIETATLMTVETLILALIAFFIMSSHTVQNIVLLHPEISVLAILMADFIIGRYRGLRLLEIWRFRELLKN